MGTNSIIISDGHTKILIDPYFTRVSKLAMLFKKVRSYPSIVARTLDKAGVDNAAAILVTHTHLDHALDIAQVASLTGAIVCGSRSTANVCLGENLPEKQIKIIEPEKPLEFGDFSVTFVQGKHLAFPRHISFFFGPDQEITKPLIPPARSFAFKEGGCYSLHFKHPSGSFLCQGSANWVPGSLDGYLSDVALLGIGGLDLHGADYWEKWFDQTVEPISPRRVYFTHWDDFMIPLNQPPAYLRKCDKVFKHLKDRASEKQGPEISLMPWQGQVELF